LEYTAFLKVMDPHEKNPKCEVRIAKAARYAVNSDLFTMKMQLSDGNGAVPPVCVCPYIDQNDYQLTQRSHDSRRRRALL